MSRRSAVWLVIAFALILGVAAACGSNVLPPFLSTPSGAAPSPTALAASPTALRAQRTVVGPLRAVSTPALAPAGGATAAPGKTPIASPAPSPTRAAKPAAVTPAARPTATPQWPAEVVITDEQIEEMAQANAVEGLTVTGLDVQFGDDTMVMTFGSLRYGIVSLKNVTLQGHFVVNNGQVNFVADRIQPRSFATSAIPTFINQALGQALSDWYVESLRIEPGQMVLTARPA